LATLLLGALVLSCGPPEERGLELEVSSLRGLGHPFAIVATDLNKDGFVDLAVTNPKVGKISIRQGHGDGTFERPFHVNTGPRPRGIVAADFDEDGHLDLAVASTGSNEVLLHRGRGDGSFKRGKRTEVGTRPFMLEPVDLNEDGHLDLVVANEGEESAQKALSVLLGDGTGRFTHTGYPSGKWGSDVAVADYNRDGKVDVAVGTWGTNDVNVHFGKGDGTFSLKRRFTYGGRGIYRVFTVDLDRDGNADMIWNDLQRNGLYVLYGDGKGEFPRTRLLAAGTGVRHIQAGDLNRDGWPDLTSANTAAGEISIILSDGNGDFLPTQHLPVGEFPRMVAIADLNGDERLDLVVTNMRSNELSVLLNRGAAPLKEVARVEKRRPTEKTAPPEPGGFRVPTGVSVAPSGNDLLVSDQKNHRVARVDIRTGAITNLAGGGGAGFAGDGGPALAARLNLPAAAVEDREGNVYIADSGNHRIRKIDVHGTIHTLAGTGQPGDSGDGGPAERARLRRPIGLAVDEAGNLFVAEFAASRIRKIDAEGTITTALGTGVMSQLEGDEEMTDAVIGAVTGLAVDSEGGLLVVDQGNSRVLRRRPDGTIGIVASEHGVERDGVQAGKVVLRFPTGVASDDKGDIYVADRGVNRIYRIRSDGSVESVVGEGKRYGHDGDGGPAAEARVAAPAGLAMDGAGNLYFAEVGSHCVRKIDTAGIITTLAGKPRGVPTAGDHGVAPGAATEDAGPPDFPAKVALEVVWAHQFKSGSDANAAYAIAVDPQGGIYVAGDVGTGADWHVIHFSGDGEKRWTYDFDGGSVEVPFGLVLTPNGQVVTAGSVFASGGTRALVISLSKDGKEIWRYEGTGNRRVRQIMRAIAADQAGNLFLVGESGGKWQVLSLAPEGVVRWTYEGGNGSAWGVAVDANGHVVVSGTTGQSWKVIALNPAGEHIWTHKVTEGVRSFGAVARDVGVSPAGQTVVTGNVLTRGSHLRVEALDSGGATVWEYLDPVGKAGIGRGVDVDPNGQVLAVGDIASDWLLLKLDPQGKLVWRFRYDGGGGRRNSDLAQAVAWLPSGDFLVAGAVHTLPPKPPSLGAVSWRVVRYRVVPSGQSM
jgi:sugar lactone lactonase YvrE